MYGKYNFNRRTEYLSYYRAFAVICILLCHLVQANPNGYVQMTAQLFNIGVEIFIIISGICFGLQGEIADNEKWYRKRMCRIYIPYEIFLLFLAIIYMIVGRDFYLANWVSCVIGIQGANVGVLGADHTWFLTALLICYMITPILSKIFCGRGMKKTFQLLTLIISGVMPMALAYVPWIVYHTIGANVCFYVIAYWIGIAIKNGFQFKKEHLWLYVCIMLCAFAGRFVGRMFWDDTRFYNCVIVGYTQYIAAFSILGIFAVIFSKEKSNKVIRWICQISFELYLYHYMFIVGPVSLMNITKSWLISSLIVGGVTVSVAMGMHIVAKRIGKVIG